MSNSFDKYDNKPYLHPIISTSFFGICSVFSKTNEGNIEAT